MKKITSLLILLLFATFAGHSQVQVGAGTNTNQHQPLEPLYAYNYSQSIYLSPEINASGAITSVQWYYSGDGGLNNTQDLTIYLGATAKTSFENGSDWEPFANLTQVYTGGITATGPGWVTINFDTPFVYNGTSNLIIAVEDNMPQSDSDSDNFENFMTVGNRSICYFSDGFNPDPANPPQADFLSNFAPNVIFGGITQACATPLNLSVNEVGTNSATLDWQLQPGSTAGGSSYYITTSADVPDNETTPSGSIPSGTTATITSGLAADTSYHAYVRNNCGNGLSSGWSMAVTFRTACLPVPSFSEDFDAVTNGALPGCWTGLIKGESVSPYAHVATDGFNFVHSGPNAVNLYNENSETIPGNDIILVSPNLSTLGAGTHRVKFFAKSFNAGIQVGTLNGISADATFTSIEEIALTNEATEYAVDLSSYTGTDTYLGFRLVAPGAFSNVYIDDVRYEINPTCQDVAGINVSAITPSGSSVSWTPGGNETAWNIAVGPANTTDPSTLTAIPATQTTAQIYNLAAATSYKVWVRSVCAENDYGAWNGPVLFTTDCNPSATFNENFDAVQTPNLPSCWSKILRGETISPNAFVQTMNENVHSAPNVIALYNSQYDSNNDIILVSPNLSTLSSGTYRLKFYARGDVGNLQVGTLDSNTDTAAFNPVETVAVSGVATQFTVDFTSYTGTDHYVGIRMAYAGSFQIVYIDDIKWEIAPTCPDVTQITVPLVSTSGATVNWVPGGTESDWNIAVGGTSVTDPSGLPFVTSSVTTFTISGLAEATAYNLWVRSACAGGDNGAWIGPVAFTTDCPAVADFNENFDAVTAPNLPDCWKQILNGATVSEFARVTTTQDNFVHSNPNSVQLYNATSNMSGTDNVMLVSPNLSNVNAGTHRVKFFAKGFGNTTLQVGTVDANTNQAIFTSLEEITLTDSATEYAVDFTGYTGNDHYIAFRNSSGIFRSVYLDDIRWETAPNCPDVTEISVAAITPYTTSLTWNAGGSETNWQIVYGPSSVTDPTVLSAILSFSNTNGTITGLTDNTSYKAWVRSVCPENENGAWIGPIAFSTSCLPAGIPYTQNFETATAPGMPDCTTLQNAGAGNNWEVHSSPGTGFPNNALVYPYHPDNSANAWFYTQGLNLTAGTEYHIFYRYGNDSDFYSEKLRVMYGLAPNADDMTEFIGEYTPIGNSTIASDDITFTPTATAVYYFGFNAFSLANQGQLYVDDIVIYSTMLGTPTTDALQFNYYPNPVGDILNLSANQNITAVAVYNLLGQTVLQNDVLNDTKASVDFSSLASGSYFIKVTADSQIKTIKIVKK